MATLCWNGVLQRHPFEKNQFLLEMAFWKCSFHYTRLPYFLSDLGGTTPMPFCFLSSCKIPSRLWVIIFCYFGCFKCQEFMLTFNADLNVTTIQCLWLSYIRLVELCCLHCMLECFFLCLVFPKSSICQKEQVPLRVLIDPIVRRHRSLEPIVISYVDNCRMLLKKTSKQKGLVQ